MTARTHTTVLLPEAVQALVHAPAGRYVDATFGRGGHSRAILQYLQPQGRLLAFDKDPQALLAAQDLDDGRFSIRQQGFGPGLEALAHHEPGGVDGVLLDLGISSPQIDDPSRGFSFRADGPLDMRMDPDRGISAAQWLAQASQQDIAEVIRDYGEERFARAIAKAIVARREDGKPVARTLDLAQLVAAQVRTRERGQHPATRTFQAVRIFINRELEELAQALEACLQLLKTGGRLVVISFHSLEDRMVKQFMARHARAEVDRRVPFAEPPAPLLRLLGRVRPGAAEVDANPRARSAIMRVAERSAAPLPTQGGPRL